jgi:hypothetical protein
VRSAIIQLSNRSAPDAVLRKAITRQRASVVLVAGLRAVAREQPDEIELRWPGCYQILNLKSEEFEGSARAVANDLPEGYVILPVTFYS